ncbi:MAG: glycosyltransferase [Myxococcota bacterium]
MAEITVVLPVFNRAGVVTRAIDSVLGQTFGDFELVVVDDDSRDGTPERVASYADPRIRLIRVDRNRGACAARNRGIDSARGGIVCFLDSDDVYRPTKLEVVRAFFHAQPALDLLVDSFVCRKGLDGNGKRTPKLNPPGLTGAEFRAAVFERRIAKATSALSVRRRAFLEGGGFDEALRRRQDFDLVLRLSRARVCLSTDQVLWDKFDSADAISRDHARFVQASIDVCDRHPEYLQAHAPALYRDLRSHFLSLIKRRHLGSFVRDARLYAGYRPFAPSLARLMLDARVSRPDSDASIQRWRAASGNPSRIAETSCAPASVE